MPNGINFAPSSKSRSKQEKGDIEYSVAAEDLSTVRIAAEVQPVAPAAVQAPAEVTPVVAEPKKTRSFFSWRKNRDTAVQQPQPVTAPQTTFGTHDAPQRQKEEAMPDLLHAQSVGSMLQKPSQMPQTVPLQPAPIQPKQVVKPQPQSQPLPKAVIPPATQPAVAVMPVSVQPAQQSQPTPQKPAPKLTRKEKKQRLVDELPMAEVNLIPNTSFSGKEQRRGLRDLGYVTAVLVGVVLLAFGGFKMYERKITADTAAVEVDIQTLNAQIGKYQDTQAQAKDVNDRLVALDQMMKTHVYWTPFLAEIERLTLPTVYYTSMTGSSTSLTFTFDAVAESYSQIAPLVESFKQSPLVTNVTISAVQQFQASTVISSSATPSTAAPQSGVSFKMSVQFIPDMFVHPQLRTYGKN